MFNKILIANRGEIACRVMRTARRLGVRTVAVFSEADRSALHVQMADEAYPIGPAPARDSYLRSDRVVEAARRSGAEAVHPGYGFLSENAEFADACAAAGLVFIGPPPAAIRAMGSKSAAKALMQAAGVPLVPGYHGAAQDPALLARHAEQIGFPVLIKASAGGGGKGMRVVERPDAFADALVLAQGEARASFGDDQVLIERYLTRPRHIEIQVFADRHGNVVHLFERDCSIQRRHQKVVEEAPAPGMTLERRDAMGRAACEAARAIGYEGAGTVEFIVEADAFYFMEMNTRLQVEHPVTELITGQDLVEWQLLIAGGERLPKLQDDLAIDGHAIEVRLYAEDPARDYRPSIGTLQHLREPPATDQVRPATGQVRIDTGVREGDAISVHYDPMIAKLIVWDRDRAGAVRLLGAALARYELAGVQTNLDLLRRVAGDAEFRAGGVDTGFLGRRPELLGAADTATPPQAALAAAAAAFIADRAQDARRSAAASLDLHSPWAMATAWRLNGDGYQDLVLQYGDAEHELRAHLHADGSFRLDGAGSDGASIEVSRQGDATVWLDGIPTRVPVVRAGATLTAIVEGRAYAFTCNDPLAPPASEGVGDDRLIAPMPGRVVSVHTEPGKQVTKGEVLLVLEAMKVQMRLTAPRDGTIGVVRVRAGELVDDGVELVSFAQPP